MTAAHLFSLFWSLPLVVQAWIVLLAVVVCAGIWTLSRAAGRGAGRLERRRGPEMPAAAVKDARRHLRAVARAPQSYIDQTLRSREIEFAGELDLDGDDLEEEAWRDMILAAVAVVVPAVWIEPLVKRRRGRRAAQVAQAERLLARRAAQSALNDAYALAEEQACAQAETGQGWSMPPSPFRAAALIASLTGEHERLSISERDRALEVALLEDAFHHEARPPVAADTDPDAATSW